MAPDSSPTAETSQTRSEYPHTPTPNGVAHDSGSTPATVADFTLTHPKNYFGVPVCVAASRPTPGLIDETLVRTPQRAIQGAAALGLVTPAGELTPCGQTFVQTLLDGQRLSAALSHLRSFRRTRTRWLPAVDSSWHAPIDAVIQSHPLIGDLVTALERTGPVTLVELARHLRDTTHPFAAQLFRHATTPEELSAIDRAALHRPATYQSAAVSQFKSMLFHLDVLTTRGQDTNALVPSEQVWALSDRVCDTLEVTQ